MEKEVSEQDYKLYGNRPLIEKDFYYVMISHKELDDLVARLMHIAELDSDKEHREALKGELKHQTRKWLDNEYEQAGYSNYKVQPGAKIVRLENVPQSSIVSGAEIKLA